MLQRNLVASVHARGGGAVPALEQRAAARDGIGGATDSGAVLTASARARTQQRPRHERQQQQRQ